MIKQSHRVSGGRVSLVGAGPGDPELLTIKALRAIEAADLILYDALVTDDILALIPEGTPAFYVGKTKGHHSLSQSELNRLMVKKAKAGQHLVRLKGGDPFVFGRGGEEMQALRDEGISVEIVPGITAASGCAAATQIPLTMRGISQACTFITGHAEKDFALDWGVVAGGHHTVVCYMGISTAATVESRLIEAGLPAYTPVAIIENGCRDQQRVCITSTASLSESIARHEMQSPALLIIGEVVRQIDSTHITFFDGASDVDATSQCA